MAKMPDFLVRTEKDGRKKFMPVTSIAYAWVRENIAKDLRNPGVGCEESFSVPTAREQETKNELWNCDLIVKDETEATS